MVDFMRTIRLFAVCVLIAFLSLGGGCASTVSGTRWYCGTMEFSFGDGNWTMFDVSVLKGEKGSYRERDNYLELTATQKYVNNNNGTNTWVSMEQREYVVTFVGDKLILDKGSGDGVMEFVKQ